MLRTLALVLVLSTLAAFPALAGTCSGGPYGGLSCTAAWQCPSWCNGGPANHWTCTSNSDCHATCAGTDYLCTYNWECPGSYCKQWYCQTYYCLTGFSASTGVSGDAGKCDAGAASLWQ